MQVSRLSRAARSTLLQEKRLEQQREETGEKTPAPVMPAYLTPPAAHHQHPNPGKPRKAEAGSGTETSPSSYGIFT